MQPPALSLFFATMSGNTESLAQRAARKARAAGWTVDLRNLNQVAAGELARIPLALFIVSTWGDGEPPADADDFARDLEKNALDLSGLRYAVLGLGDRGYADFNAFARTLDHRLAALGANRLHARIEADIDYEDTYVEWETLVFPLLPGASTLAARVA